MNGQECATKTINVDGVAYPRVPYPPTELGPSAGFPGNCRDCNTPKGGLHHRFCCLDMCPVGDGQFLGCAHGPHA